MKLIKMECPYCGGDLQVQEGQTSMVCPYCGNTVRIDEEKNESVVTIKDEAKIKEAELKSKQYEDFKKNEDNIEKKSFKKTKTAIFIIVLIVIDFLFTFTAFMSDRVASGIVGLIQIVLLIVAMEIGNGTIQKIKGKKISYNFFIVISCLLSILFCKMITFDFYDLPTIKLPKREKLVWPSTELADKLPDPNAKYGEVVVNNDEHLDVDINKYNEDKYQEYVQQCKDRGFTIESSYTGDMYEAMDINGYVLNLTYSSDSMSISLDAPIEFEDITWPVSPLAALLPAPPGNKGAIKTNNSWVLEILIPDIDDEKFSQYTSSVLNDGFSKCYQNNNGMFVADNEDGTNVNIKKEIGNVMDIHLVASYKSTSETTPTPEVTPVSTPTSTNETQVSAAPASGIRPEFKEAMDSYKAFFDSYCEFMKSYDASDTTMLAKYSQFMSQYADTMQKLDAVDESELSPEEDDYYLQTMAAINQELLEVAQTVN